MRTNDREIIFYRQFLVELAKNAELNVSHVRLLSEVENHEIVFGVPLPASVIGSPLMS